MNRQLISLTTILTFIAGQTLPCLAQASQTLASAHTWTPGSFRQMNWQSNRANPSYTNTGTSTYTNNSGHHNWFNNSGVGRNNIRSWQVNIRSGTAPLANGSSIPISTSTAIQQSTPSIHLSHHGDYFTQRFNRPWQSITTSAATTSNSRSSHNLIRPTGHHPLWLANHTRIWSNTTVNTSTATPSVNLDLSSSSQSMNVGRLLPNGTITINVGGTNLTVDSKTQLTPSEYLAAVQVIHNNGQQSLTLNSQGSASGGSVLINNRLSNLISGLVIPQGVTVVDLTKSGSINLANNLTNNGSLYVTSFNPNVTGITLGANNISVGGQGTISNVLPVGLFRNNTNHNLNLNLNAINNISNSGTIASGGALTLAVGGSITNTAAPTISTPAPQPVIQAQKDINLISGSGQITNSGLVTSANGNINISSSIAKNDININGTNGTFQASNGAINVRDSAYNGNANININGGNYLSQQFNLHSGTGTIELNAGQITGQLNTDAGVVHVNANTPVLTLGNQSISGDPTYANTGNIDINGVMTITGGADLAIIAGGNILSTSTSASIVDNGGNVLMIAGANITSGGGTGGASLSGTNPSGAASGTVTVSLTGGSGGNIDFAGFTGGTASTKTTVIDTSNNSGAGGNVTLVALLNGSNGGTVALGNSTSAGGINTSGTTGGGNVTIFGGSNGAAALVTNITTSGFGSSTTKQGSVLLETTQAATSDGNALTINTSGDITSGNSIVASQLSNGSIIMNPAALINTSSTSVGGNVLIISGNAFSDISGTSQAGSITTTGSTQGGNVAIITQSSLLLTNITTTGGTTGSVYLSSPFHITTSAITSSRVLATTRSTAGTLTTTSFTSGNSINISSGHIVDSGAAVSVTVLSPTFSNSGSTTITPASIPAGGFTSFTNTGTIQLSNDSNASNLRFNGLVPFVVNAAVPSLGTITDNTSASANFVFAAPSVAANNSATPINVNVGGSIQIYAPITTGGTASGSVTLTAGGSIIGTTINTNGANGTSGTSGSAGGAGGAIVLNSLSYIFINSSLTSTGGNGGNGSSGSGGVGGSGAAIDLASNSVIIAGNLSAAGGAGGTGSPSGNHGNGGTIVVATNSSTPFVLGSAATSNGITGTINTAGSTGTSGALNVTNANGDIQIDSSIGTSGSALTLVASGNITNITNSDAINTSTTAAGFNGGNINLVAGANFSVAGNFSTISITGPSSTGGNIDLNTTPITALTSASLLGNGGNINLIAYKVNSGTGLISTPSGVTITADGSNAGSGGYITVIAAGAVPSIGQTSSSAGTPGTITVGQAPPNGSVGTPVVITTATGVVNPLFGSAITLTSLDLTNSTVQADITALIAAGTPGISGTFSNLTIDASVSPLVVTLDSLTAFNVPNGDLLDFTGFTTGSPTITINLTGSSTTTQTLVGGSVSFTNSGNSIGEVDISSNQTGPALSISSTGLFTSDNQLTITAPSVQNNGILSASSRLIVAVTGSGSISGTGTYKAPTLALITTSGNVTSDGTTTGSAVQVTSGNGGGLNLNTGGNVVNIQDSVNEAVNLFSFTGTLSATTLFNLSTVGNLTGAPSVFGTNGNSFILQNYTGSPGQTFDGSAFTVSGTTVHVTLFSSTYTVDLSSGPIPNGGTIIFTSGGNEFVVINNTGSTLATASGLASALNTYFQNGSILYPIPHITSPTILLSSQSGSIGSSTQPVNVNNNGSGISLLHAFATGNVFLADTSNEHVVLSSSATLGVNTAGSTFSLSTVGNILSDTTNIGFEVLAIQAPTIILNSSNGNIAQDTLNLFDALEVTNGGNNITLHASAPTGSVAIVGESLTDSFTLTTTDTGGASTAGTNFTIDSNGNIYSADSQLAIQAPNIFLFSGAGNIAANSSLNPLLVSGGGSGLTALFAFAQGSVYMSNFTHEDVFLTGSNSGLNSGASSVFNLSTYGNIYEFNTGVAIQAPTIFLSSATGSIAADSSNNPLSISSSSGSGITSLFATAPSGSVYLTDTTSESVTLNTSSSPLVAGGTFNLVTVGSIFTNTVGNTAIQAPTISFRTTNGNIGANSSATSPLIITGGGTGLNLYAFAANGAGIVNIVDPNSESIVLNNSGTTALTGSTSFTLSTTGSISVSNSSNVAIESPIISLTALNGNITDDGTFSGQAIQVSSGGGGGGHLTLSAQATQVTGLTGVVNLTDSNAEAAVLSGTNSGAAYLFSSLGNLTVASNVNASSGDLILQNSVATGNITINPNLSLTAPLGDILIVVGNFPSSPYTQGTTPANVNVTTANGGAVYFGPFSSNITATSSMDVKALGQNVIFNISNGAGTITLGDGDLIQAGTTITPPTPTPTPTPTPVTPSNHPGISTSSITLSSNNQSSSPFSEFLQFFEFFSLLHQESLLTQQNILDEQIGTRTATDYTPFTIYPYQPQVSESPLQGQISAEQLESVGEALFSAKSFDGNALDTLAKEGIVFGKNSKDNFLDLVKGFVFFMPESNISVQTREGIVNIPKGAQVWVMETGADAAIYDLHDSIYTGPVKVVVNNKEMVLSPGTEVLLTRNSTADFSALNPGNALGYRNIRCANAEQGIKTYVCNFSIANGLANVPVIHSLLTSNDPKGRKAAWKMIKNATILADITGDQNYKTEP